MSYKIYPITPSDISYEGYKIKINGEYVKPDSARVSAMPFNRRWPGHQRGMEQSELVNFISLETDEELTFEIEPKDPFDKVEIRPKSLGITPEIVDGKIKFTLQKSAYFTVEPYGRHNALHIFADPVSHYDIDKDSEDVIYFGAGEHDAGMIYLKSNQTLFIDEGAVVYGCVRATDADNIKILGRGILDNSRNKEKILFEVNAVGNDTAVKNAKRLHTIQPEYCTNITIEGITMRDSLVYNIRPLACRNLDISNIKIIGCWRYNSDGIDMHNCENVTIDNCFIRTFDDSICIKGFDCYYEGDVEKAVQEAMHRNGENYEDFRNVRISNCVIWNDWGRSLEIGAETRAEHICDIVFNSCDIIHVTDVALDCQNVDYADIHDVTFSNINIELDDTIPTPMLQRSDDHEYTNIDPDYSPAIITAEVLFHYEYSAGGTRRGKNHDITFSNIHLYGRQKPKFCFRGYNDEHKTYDIKVEKFYVNDKLIDEDDFSVEINEYCENITIV